MNSALELELELAARLADREREIEAQHWVREIQRARRVQPAGNGGERQPAGWQGYPRLLRWLALAERFNPS